MKKVTKCLTAICHLQSEKGDLERPPSIIGLLNFACSVIIPGRAFLRRLINLIIGIKRPYHFIRLNTEVKKDLRIWQTFLDSFNGKSFFLEERWSSSYSLCFYSDAAQSKGYGLIFGKQWAYDSWPESWTEYSISFLEFFPIVAGLGIWSNEFKNRRVLFYIGAASWAAAKRMSDAQIRAFGRWKSNAFLLYIRTPSLGSESYYPAVAYHMPYLYFTIIYPRAQLLSRGQLSVP